MEEKIHPANHTGKRRERTYGDFSRSRGIKVLYPLTGMRRFDPTSLFLVIPARIFPIKFLRRRSRNTVRGSLSPSGELQLVATHGTGYLRPKADRFRPFFAVKTTLPNRVQLFFPG